MSPEKKQQIVSALIAGESVRAISERYDTPIGTVNYIRSQMKAEVIGDSVDTVSVIEPEVLVGVSDHLRENGLHKAAQEAKNLASSVERLQKFHPDLIEAGNMLLRQVVAAIKAPEQMSMREMKDAADVITKLNSSFFNSNVSNTLIQINNSDEVNMQAKTELLRMREERIKQLKGEQNGN